MGHNIIEVLIPVQLAQLTNCSVVLTKQLAIGKLTFFFFPPGNGLRGSCPTTVVLLEIAGAVDREIIACNKLTCYWG